MFSIYYLRRYERIHQLFFFIYCLFLRLLPSSPNHSFEQTPCCSPSPPSIRFSSSLESLPPPTYSFSTCKNSTQMHFRKKNSFSNKKQCFDKEKTVQMNKLNPQRFWDERNEPSANNQIRTNPKRPESKAALLHYLWSHQWRLRWPKVR